MGKGNEGREIGKYLKSVKTSLKISNKKFSKFIQDEPEVVNGLEKIEDKEIPLNILYQLSWFANLKWRECCQSMLKDKVENVKKTRDLRDACDREIVRRLKL